LPSTAPERASNVDGIDSSLFPPCALVTGAMNLTMVDAAKRDDEFIAHLAAQRTWLHEAQVVRIGMLSPTNQTRLFSNKPQMFFVAMATWFGDHKNALVDAGLRVRLRRDRRMWSWYRRRGRNDLSGWRSAGAIGLQF
jgi:hypothetical protein